MILFTGHGAIASSFEEKYICEIVSIRDANLDELEKLLPLYDVVIHNAANIHPANIEQATEDNFVLTKRVLDTLNKVNPAARFIYLSSMSFLKNSDEYFNPLEMTPYAFSKYLGEIYTLHHPLSNAVSVRFSTIFYRNPLKDGLSKLIFEAATNKHVNIVNGGEAKRDFLPLDVLVQYLYKICKDTRNKKTYTLCSGRAVSFAQAIDWISNNIEELKIQNTFVNKPANVMHEFSTESIKELGEVVFDLKDFVSDYIKALKKT